MVDPWDDASTPAGEKRTNDDDDRPLEFADESERDLHQHLIWQLETSPLDPRQVWIGEAIIDALNDDGYLTESLADILESLTTDLPVTLDEVEQVLALRADLRSRPGSARAASPSASACSSLSSSPRPRGAISRSSSRRNICRTSPTATSTALRRALNVDEDALQEAMALDPGLPATSRVVLPVVAARVHRPGRIREAHGAGLGRRDQSRFRPASQGQPELRRRRGAIRRLRDAPAQLQEARWLIRSLEIRSETLLKVARTIVQRQSAFLEKGDEAMEPMILRDVAEAVSMHESTISRVTTGKYMHTPRGIFEFRYFFSSHVAGTDGGDVSSVAIRARIRRLIADEDATRPLSDAQLAELLASEGIKVARRTVAKYRESLGSRVVERAPPGGRAATGVGQAQMRLVVVSGLSGSGKSIALNMLEDLDYYCVDNIPAGLLPGLVDYTVRSHQPDYERTAVGLDARNRPEDLADVPRQVEELRRSGIRCEIVFLRAENEVLLKRFSETRRRHPLSRDGLGLQEALQQEQRLLAPVANSADLIHRHLAPVGARAARAGEGACRRARRDRAVAAVRVLCLPARRPGRCGFRVRLALTAESLLGIVAPPAERPRRGGRRFPRRSRRSPAPSSTT